MSFGPRVGRTTVGSEASLIADTDGVLVVMPGMCPRQILMPRLIHMTVARDIIMVASEAEAGVVTGYEVLDREPAVAARRTAMNND